MSVCEQGCSSTRSSGSSGSDPRTSTTPTARVGWWHHAHTPSPCTLIVTMHTHRHHTHSSSPYTLTIGIRTQHHHTHSPSPYALTIAIHAHHYYTHSQSPYTRATTNIINVILSCHHHLHHQPLPPSLSPQTRSLSPGVCYVRMAS